MIGPFRQLSDQHHSDMQQAETVWRQGQTVYGVNTVWTWLALAFKYIQVYDYNVYINLIKLDIWHV